MTKQSQFKRIRKRFEISVQNFGRSCFNLKANEKAFQAWFGAMVIQEFGLSRVYREIHLPKRGLEHGGNSRRLPTSIRPSQGNELFPDVSVSWEPAIDARHASTRSRESWPEATKQMIRQLAIISELKVTGSTKSPTLRKDIVQDLLKLHLFAETHRVLPGRPPPMATYMIVMDNNEDARFDDGWLSGVFETVASKWPRAEFERPTTIAIREDREDEERVSIVAYRADGKVREL